ncbi:LytTR family DNA-binding domain-containing protein [Lipingzhangella sp. LS1_29]|uniref:LytTR family DNA-binding domain-containing protein n=1 Tax=Lipingzhangella rawalii TaxID=2055835 RepID=A0ABU2H8K5_9ACTN|nr:LytTR family DNA-binding domain-containing protein [Lipingzhangella rawalii]MDS1271632.1 LytTR family DNA-binding domain-containing protein [Lipingzhangella rawalii]
MSSTGPTLRCLVVEDETGTREELAGLLRSMPEIVDVTTAATGADAVRLLGTHEFHAAFLDILMPGLDGMDVARVLSNLARPPAIVFVTASEAHAVDAFGVGAVDYLLKPIRAERLAEAVSRILALRRPDPVPDPDDELDVVQIEVGRRTVFVRRDDIQFVEAQGDYVRLCTAEDSHLIRLSLSYLEDIWASAGFTRTHRGYLVAVPWVRDLRVTNSAGLVAVTPAGDVPVSRRHTRALKERLLAAARESHPMTRGTGGSTASRPRGEE